MREGRWVTVTDSESHGSTFSAALPEGPGFCHGRCAAGVFQGAVAALSEPACLDMA